LALNVYCFCDDYFDWDDIPIRLRGPWDMAGFGLLNKNRKGR
jgi:hypothetical protein